jgi:hypothetical protein
MYLVKCCDRNNNNENIINQLVYSIEQFEVMKGVFQNDTGRYEYKLYNDHILPEKSFRSTELIKF